MNKCGTYIMDHYYSEIKRNALIYTIWMNIKSIISRRKPDTKDYIQYAYICHLLGKTKRTESLVVAKHVEWGGGD